MMKENRRTRRRIFSIRNLYLTAGLPSTKEINPGYIFTHFTPPKGGSNEGKVLELFKIYVDWAETYRRSDQSYPTSDG